MSRAVFPAIHLGHGQIGKHKVEGRRAHLFNRFLTTSRQLYAVIDCDQHLGECFSHGLFIIDYENPQAWGVAERRR